MKHNTLLSGKQRKAQLKLKRAIKRGDTPQPPVQPQKRKKTRPQPHRDISSSARALQSQFVKLDRSFLDDTRALAGSIVLRRPILVDVAVPRREWIAHTQVAHLTVPRRPRWRYQMSKDELDANEQTYFHTWIAQQDAIVTQWQHRPVSFVDDFAGDRVDDSETCLMPHPPTHFERNIEVWRQFWRVTEISQILLLLLDSRCPPLHLPTSLCAHLGISTSSIDSDPRTKRSGLKAPCVIFVLTKVDISGLARTASWTSFLNANYPDVPVVPVEAYAPKLVEQGAMRYEPHLPGNFRERLVHTLREVHDRLLHLPQWVTTPRPDESEEERLQRISRWKPRVKRVIDWDGVLKASGNLVGKAVGGAAVPKSQEVEGIVEEDNVRISDSEEEQADDAYEWQEPEFLTVGAIGQPNVGKSSLLNAIFGKTRVRASRTPGKTKHFQTLFWTSDVRLVDCPGLVMPSFVPMDIQVLSGVLPISRVSAVPFCVHQLARLLPLEQILELTHPSLSTSPAFASSLAGQSTSNAEYDFKPVPAQTAAGEDRRTWRPGQRPPEQSRAQPRAPRWTANDIMTAYAEKKGWVTAKAGRPDIHRAGNAILRLVSEGKIPWGFWPPGGSVSGEDGIWLKDGMRGHAWDELEEGDEEDDSADQDSEMEETSSEDEEQAVVHSGTVGRFGALRVE